jgi:hypothetical protein
MQVRRGFPHPWRTPHDLGEGESLTVTHMDDVEIYRCEWNLITALPGTPKHKRCRRWSTWELGYIGLQVCDKHKTELMNEVKGVFLEEDFLELAVTYG